jgi:cytochrome c oxidase subunit II
VTDIAARYETRWAVLMTAIIISLLAVVVFTGLHWASMPPSRVETIDATTLHLKGEFTEGNLGAAVDARGRITVHLLAEQYSFRPQCLVLPQGEPVTFRATSSDAVHGILITGTNINTMLVPGYVSTFVATLQELGEHAVPCHEFCGVGHAAMWARVRVVPKATFDQLVRTNPRPGCV